MKSNLFDTFFSLEFKGAIHAFCFLLYALSEYRFCDKIYIIKNMFVGRYKIKPPAKILIIRRIIWSLYV